MKFIGRIALSLAVAVSAAVFQVEAKVIIDPEKPVSVLVFGHNSDGSLVERPVAKLPLGKVIDSTQLAKFRLFLQNAENLGVFSTAEEMQISFVTIVDDKFARIMFSGNRGTVLAYDTKTSSLCWLLMEESKLMTESCRKI